MSGDACEYVPTKWAQRKDMLLITFNVEDCIDTDIKFEANKIIFHGQGGTMKKKYNAEIQLYKEIDPENCKWEQTSRLIFVHAGKKESGPFWPRLLNIKGKQHWLHLDFDKMKDEDDSSSDEEELGLGGQQPDLAEMMAQMGKGTGTTDFGDLDDEPDSDDSDDEEVPELETEPKSETLPKENGDAKDAGEPQVCDA